MIQITSEQIERVNLILSGIPGGAQKAFSSVIRRANSTVKAETVRQITGTYAISAQHVRAGGISAHRSRKRTAALWEP